MKAAVRDLLRKKKEEEDHSPDDDSVLILKKKRNNNETLLKLDYQMTLHRNPFCAFNWIVCARRGLEMLKRDKRWAPGRQPGVTASSSTASPRAAIRRWEQCDKLSVGVWRLVSRPLKPHVWKKPTCFVCASRPTHTQNTFAAQIASLTTWRSCAEVRMRTFYFS